MGAYHVGQAPPYADWFSYANGTVLDKNNPADGAGAITTLEVWMRSAGYLTIATFYAAGGSNYTCRSSQYLGWLAGQVTLTLPVSITVAVGDFLGGYYVTSLANMHGGGVGVLFNGGNCTSPGSTYSFSALAGGPISARGGGATPEPTSQGFDGSLPVRMARIGLVLA